MNNKSGIISRLSSALLQNKSEKQTIAKNTFWLSISETTGRLLRVIIIIYAARVLGAAGWGAFSYMASLAAILTIFSDIGISTVLIREVVKNPSARESYFSTAFVLKLVLAGISLSIILFGVPFFTGIPISKALILFIGLLFIFDSFRRFGTSLFRAEERMEWEAFVNIITQVIIVSGGLLALLMVATPESLAAAYATGAGVGLFITGYLLRDSIKNIFSSFTKSLIKPIIKAAWPLSIAAVFSALLVNIDTVMIGWFKDATNVGLYAAAQRPIALLYILPTLIVGGFFPALARFANKDKEQFGDVLERGLKFIFLAAFPIAIGIILTADQIVSVLYGAEYILSASSLRILSLTILTAFPIGIIIHGIFAYDKQHILVPLWATGTLLNIGLNLLLIPRMGISGAAWASLITQIVINTPIWIYMRHLNHFSIGKKLLPIVLATTMMSIAIILVRQFEANIFVVVSTAILVYFGSLVFSGERPLLQLKEGIQKNK